MAVLKNVLEILSYVVGIVAALMAVCTYRGNARRERAKWAAQLYEKFYESERYRRIREFLDSAPDSAPVRLLVDGESPEFTDYLNFFEMIACLVFSSGQLKRVDALDLMQYYFQCLKRHSAVVGCLGDPSRGFEQLARFLEELD